MKIDGKEIAETKDFEIAPIDAEFKHSNCFMQITASRVATNVIVEVLVGIDRLVQQSHVHSIEFVQNALRTHRQKIEESQQD